MDGCLDLLTDKAAGNVKGRWRQSDRPCRVSQAKGSQTIEDTLVYRCGKCLERRGRDEGWTENGRVAQRIEIRRVADVMDEDARMRHVALPVVQPCWSRDSASSSFLYSTRRVLVTISIYQLLSTGDLDRCISSNHPTTEAEASKKP